MPNLTKIEGVGAVNAKKMAKAGIQTTDGLLKHCCTKKGRKQAAADSGISEKLILRWANMADRTIRELAYGGWRPKSPDLTPRDDRFDDGALVTADVGGYRPNPWGLYDLHGNAAEWTRSSLRPYPEGPDRTGRDADRSPEKVVRGGSWYDRPRRCRSAFRLGYPPYQRVFNVGFRVVCEVAPKAKWQEPTSTTPAAEEVP